MPDRRRASSKLNFAGPTNDVSIWRHNGQTPNSVDSEQAFTLVRRIIVFNIQVARTYCLFNANDMNVPWGPGTFMSFACLPHSCQSFPLCPNPSRSAREGKSYLCGKRQIANSGIKSYPNTIRRIPL